MSHPLSPDQWLELESLIDALLDTPPERRAALFADVSRGNTTRRAELERLVAECERAYPLLDQTAAERFAALVHVAPVAISQLVAERYRIARELGRGGMATVFLARDLKHDRDVAIKIIRSEIAAALGGSRFLREIEIAARLRHPNIVPLYESGDAEGLLYYVMPFESGESLRERLRRDGRLPVAETISILRDVCDALTYAHRAGVVHRDIKPDNVLLAGRHALVTDFGIAKALSAPAREDAVPGGSTDALITGAGTLIGTPAYMAPEQASADPRVDRRADIYAFGVLAFEMLTGHPPFVGDVAHEVLSAQLSHTPAPVTKHRPDVPRALADLITKCLKKRPEDRWQTTDEILARLETMRSSGAAADQRSTLAARRPVTARRLGAFGVVVAAVVGAMAVWSNLRSPRGRSAQMPPALAVLVFDHGGGQDLERLALALTDNLIAALGELPRIDVRSLRAVMPYRNPNIHIDSVGRALNAPWIVHGKVDRIGAQNVVSVQLTEASTRRLLARAQVMGGATGNDLALIDELVAKVSVMLRVRIGDHVRVAQWRSGTRSARAFADVTRAYRDWRDADALLGHDIAGARRLLQRADSLLVAASQADPKWTEPHIQRAWIARRLGFAFGQEGFDPKRFGEMLHRGLAHVDAALRVSPGDPQALEARGVLLYGLTLTAPADSAEQLLRAAERGLTQATNADSTLARGLNVLSAIHLTRNELGQARQLAERAYFADAFSDDAEQVLARLFQIDFDDGNDTGAQRWCTAYGRRSSPGWFPAYCRLQLMTWDSTHVPNVDEARRLARAATAATPPDLRRGTGAQLQVLVAGVLARVGRTNTAERMLADVHEAIAKDSAIAGIFETELLRFEAGVRMRMGQRDQAARLVRRYLELQPNFVNTIARGRPFRGIPVDSLRGGTPPVR